MAFFLTPAFCLVPLVILHIHEKGRKRNQLSNSYRKKMCCVNTILLAICAVIFPPFPVLLIKGPCSSDLLLNILLTLLGYIPGLIHAIIVISARQNERRLDKWYYQQGWIARDRLNGTSPPPQTEQPQTQQPQEQRCDHHTGVHHDTQAKPTLDQSESSNLLGKSSPPPYTV